MDTACAVAAPRPPGSEPSPPPPGGAEQWVDMRRHISLTFAGVSLGTTTVRCLALVGALGRPAHPLTPAVLDRLPPGARAVYLSSQTIARRLPTVFTLGRGFCYVPLQGARLFIDLNGSFDAYLGKFSAKTRNTMRRKMRRFVEAESGGAAFREFRRPDEMPEFHALAAEVSRKGYQHRLLRAGIDPSPAFLDDLSRRAAGGEVRGYILSRGGRAIAYMFCEARCGDLVVDKMGFDPACGADSPGLVLLSMALRHLFDGGEFRRLDLGEGVYPYKEHLATGSIDVAEIFCFPRTVRNAALVGLHLGSGAASAVLRSALEALGLAHRLKKIIRHGAGRNRRE